MSTCLIISQGEKMYIGADTACSVKTENGYRRFSNNMQKLFTIGNSIFFCSGKKQDVEKCVTWIYNSFNNSIDVMKLEQYLKDNFSAINQDNVFNIEFLLCDYNTYCVTQLSQYNNFEPIKYEKSNQLRIICGGYKTKDSFFIAKDNILSQIPIKNVYNNVFDNIADECVGGNIILFNSPIHFEEILVNEKNIKYANSDNLFLLTSDFVTTGYIYGSQIISGDIYSENYKVDANGNVVQGSHLALKDGSFNFGAGSLTYNETDGLYVKGNITSGSTITGSKFVGGSIKIGDKFEVNESGVLTAVDGNFSGTITSKDGKIANWIIGENTLTGGNIELNSEGSIKGGSTYQWSIAKDGTAIFNKLTANNATINGTVTTDALTATGGTMKGLTITGSLLLNGGYLTTNTSRTSYNQKTPGMTLDKNGIGGYASDTAYWNMSSTGILTAVGATLTNANVSGTITTNDIKATGGSIGSWSIYDSAVLGAAHGTSGNFYGMAFDARKSMFDTVSSNSDGGRVIAVGRLGNSSTSSDTAAMTTATWENAALQVFANGKLVTKNIEVGGGTIGGWTIESYRLSGANDYGLISIYPTGVSGFCRSGSDITYTTVTWYDILSAAMAWRAQNPNR